MKIKPTIISLLLTTLLFNVAIPVMALQLKVTSTEGKAGDTLQLDITVSGYENEKIAASAFTLKYNRQQLQLAKVESEFFDTFLKQWKSLNPVPSPLPPTSFILKGISYTQPLLVNIDHGSPTGPALLVGARAIAGTPKVLFTVYFKIAEYANAGIYPVTISPSRIFNTNAGYSLDGESIPILVGAVEGESDLSKAYPTYAADLVSGAITVFQSFQDSDNDGIDDNWEILHFGNLKIANQTTDYDGDGYSDLQEYLNELAGEPDPDGNSYNPKEKNTPGGTGYNNPDARNRFWIQMLPAILSGRTN